MAAFKAARHHDDYVKEAYVEEMIENVLESNAANEANQEVPTKKVVSKKRSPIRRMDKPGLYRPTTTAILFRYRR